MFRSRFGRRKYLRRGRKQLGKGYRKSRISKSVKRYVKKEIHRNLENKEVVKYAANQSLATGSAGVVIPNIGLIPDITLGTSSGTRIGTQYKIVSGIIRGTINILPYNATTNPNPMPVWVRMMIVRQLNITGASASLVSGYTDTIFKTSGVSVSPQANPLDMDFAINDMSFRLVYNRVFKLGAAGSGTTNPVSSGSYFDNSPMAKKFTINWGKYCKKVLKIDSVNYPQNENLYLLIQPVYADGSSTGTYTTCEWHYVNTVKFEDA